MYDKIALSFIFFFTPFYSMNQNTQSSILSDLEFGSYLPNFASDSNDYTCPSSLQVTFQPSENKKLIYLAIFHTNDIKGNVAQRIEEVIKHEKPDLCILEGFEACEGLNPERIVIGAQERMAADICPDNLYAVFMCNKYGVNFMGGEVDDVKETLPLLYKRGYTLQDIVFYMLVQQIPFWHKDKMFKKDDVKKQCEEFMNEQVPFWFKMSINYTYEEFLAWYLKHMKKAYNPETDLLWDNGTSTEPWAYRGPEATICQKIAADIMNIRDNHIIKVIRQALQEHKKVVAIFGTAFTGGHYLWQKKALLSLFGQPLSESTF